MAMSRFFSHYLPLRTHPTRVSTLLRHRSSKPHQLIELDLDSSTASSDSVEVVVGGYKKLEEVLQSIIARRAAPDWLPFLPGYSYYVPPPPPSGHSNSFIEVLGSLSDSQFSSSQFSNSRKIKKAVLARDETMSFHSFLTNQGWPSSAYFIEGTAPTDPHPSGLVVEVKICDGEESEQESSSEEE